MREDSPSTTAAAVALARGIAGLDPAAPGSLAEADLSGRIALVFGAEGTGLRRLTAEKCDYHVRIPIAAAAESLNLSAAAAIAAVKDHPAFAGVDVSSGVETAPGAKDSGKIADFIAAARKAF